MDKPNAENKPLCVYCGVNVATTEDHVIPKCLFDGSLPNDPLIGAVKVPACQPCNNKKFKNDDYLRDMLVIDNDSSDNSTVKSLLNGKVIRSARRNRSSVVKTALTKGQLAPRHFKGGVYIGHYYSVTLDYNRIVEIFTYIVKGLYYKKFDTRMPNNYSIEIMRVDPFRIKQAFDDFLKRGASGPYRVGNVFGCLLMYADEDPFYTAWFMWFYGSICFIVNTTPINNLEENPQ